MASPPIKFGILGCAGIARKVSRAIRLVPNAALYAVGSRTLEKAAKFAKDNGFPELAKVYGSYEDVLDDPEVDVVYVPLPTSLHIKWAVLLEKPVALNVAELDTILEACESNGLQFMDSTMWMHHPRTAKMKEFLSDSSLFGEFQSAYSSLLFAASKDFLENNIRVNPNLDALGVLGDAGWYCIRSILWAADFQLPNSVVALPGTVFNSVGVITACSAALNWEGGKTATFNCSFFGNLTMDMIVVGNNGTLHVRDYIIPFEENQASFFTSEKSGLLGLQTGWVQKPSENVIKTDLPQEALMVREFSRLVGSIKFDGAKPEKSWPMLSRKTQLVLDAVKASIDKGHQIVEVKS